MSNFSDLEDRDLVRLVMCLYDQGKKISWIYVAQQMAYSKKTNEQLRMRLKTLKKTHGQQLNKFPRHLTQLAKPPNQNRSKAPNTESTRSLEDLLVSPTLTSLSNDLSHASSFNLLQEFNNMMENWESANSKHGVPPQSNTATRQRTTKNQRLQRRKHRGAVERVLGLPTNPMPPIDARQVAYKMFLPVPKSIVHQKSGEMDTNVGELTGLGVSELVKVCCLTNSDVFMDVGSGVGNVIVQVSLETGVMKCIGVEMRADVAEAGLKLIQMEAPRLVEQVRVSVVIADIRKLQLADDRRTSIATVLYAHNTVFQVDSNLALVRACCKISSLRLVVLCTVVCPRHRPSCTEEFCLTWELTRTVEVGVTYNSSAIAFHVYKRRSWIV
jgi:hypothetical protein